MNRVITLVAAILLSIYAIPAMAQDERATHRNGSLGFHHVEAPVGIRWWFMNQKLGVDLGMGYSTQESELFPDENVTGWSFDAGVPIVVKSWRRVHVLFRPGLFYKEQEVETTTPPAAFETGKDITVSVTGELEAEVFLADNFSVSASHGIAWQRTDPANAENRTGFATLGDNFSHIGFHVYLFGASEH